MIASRRVLLVAGLAGVAVGLVACSSGGGSGDGSSGSSGSSGGPASTATVTTVTSTAVATSSTASSTPTSAPSGSASVPSSRPVASGSPQSPGIAACQTGSLRLASGGSDGGAGTQYLSWTLTNTGSRTCSMTGYVGFSALNSAGAIIGKPANRDPSQLPQGTTGSGPRTVTLIPNARAQFVVASINAVPNQKCPTRQYASAVQVFPPNQTQALRIASAFITCDMRVGPLRPVS